MKRKESLTLSTTSVKEPVPVDATEDDLIPGSLCKEIPDTVNTETAETHREEKGQTMKH